MNERGKLISDTPPRPKGWARQSANARELQAYLEIAALWRALATRQAEASPAGRAPAGDAAPRDAHAAG